MSWGTAPTDPRSFSFDWRHRCRWLACPRRRQCATDPNGRGCAHGCGEGRRRRPRASTSPSRGIRHTPAPSRLSWPGASARRPRNLNHRRYILVQLIGTSPSFFVFRSLSTAVPNHIIALALGPQGAHRRGRGVRRSGSDPEAGGITNTRMAYYGILQHVFARLCITTVSLELEMLAGSGHHLQVERQALLEVPHSRPSMLMIVLACRSRCYNGSRGRHRL